MDYHDPMLTIARVERLERLILYLLDNYRMLEDYSEDLNEIRSMNYGSEFEPSYNLLSRVESLKQSTDE